MSSSLRKSLNVGIILLTVVLLSVLILGNSASAQAEPEDTSNSNFSYEAETGDSLTLLVRRSIELYSQNNEIELSEGRAIAAETCAVQEMGAFELNVGQAVEVTEENVKSAVTKAQDLDEAAEARWAAYGPISRNITTVQPVSAPEYVETEDIKQPLEVKVEDDSKTSQIVENTNTEATDSEDAPWYWWAIGGSAIGAMWYVLGGNEAVKNRRKK